MQGGDGTTQAADARAALQGIRAALAFFAAGALVGGPWDMLWHLQSPFESFFSAPHLFIYGMTAASIVLVLSIALKPQLRGAFGEGRRIPLLGQSVPGSLVLLGAGLLVLLLSGLLDELWHGAFGVDETRLSTPHAMFGWGLFVAMLGFASARLALAKEAPVGRGEAVLLAFLTLAFSLYAFLLPFLVYPTDATLRAIAGLPVIQAQSGAAHTFRIYEAWGVERSNPIFAVIAALWGGAALKVCGSFDERPNTSLSAVAIASALYSVLWFAFAARLGTQADPRSWLPLPALPAVLLLWLGRRKGWNPSTSQWLAAAAFAGLTVLVWPPGHSAANPVAQIAIFAASMVAFKAALLASGVAVLAVVEPNRRAAPGLPLVLGILIPIMLGLLDLSMRWTTP